MRAAVSKILIVSVLTGLSPLASADAVADDWNEKAIAAGHASAPAPMQPSAAAQTERRGMSAFIAAYQGWKIEQGRRYRMGAFPPAPELAIMAYAEHGECAVVDGFLFGMGWHHIPGHEQYTDEDALQYGKSIDALVAICETIERDGRRGSRTARAASIEGSERKP